MQNLKTLVLVVALCLALTMTALVLPAIGQSGDYGVNTGSGCGVTHYCTPTPETTGTPGTPVPTNTVQAPNFGTG